MKAAVCTAAIKATWGHCPVSATPRSSGQVWLCGRSVRVDVVPYCVELR
jgi:hypothetical protein